MSVVRLSFGALLLALTAGTVSAQDASGAQPKSIAEMAAQAKTNKTIHAKVRLDDDSEEAKRSPIPDIAASDFADNSDDIVRAIIDYRTSHTARETEDVVHAWYDKYDLQLERALDDNRRINSRQSQGYYPAYYPDSNSGPRNIREYQDAAAAYQRSAIDDYQRRTQNFVLSGRIRTTFTKVRSQIKLKSMDWDWFVIRDGN